MSGFIENSGSGTIVALNGTVQAKLSAAATAVFAISGTWSGTLIFEATVDGTTFFTVGAVSLPANTYSPLITSNGNFGIAVGGLSSIRLRASLFTSGTVTVNWNSDSFVNPNLAVNQLIGATDATPVGNTLDRLKVTSIPSDGNTVDAFGRFRVSTSDLLEALHFSNSAHPLLINTATTGSATTAYNSATSSLRLTTTTSSSDTAIVQTKRYFRYNPGRSYMITLSGNIGTAKTNVRKRWGYFDANNGIFFEQTSTALSAVIRTNASGSPVDTAVTQANWNVDKLDGTGASGINLDLSKHNLFVIDYLWHGAGRVRFGVFYNGQIVYCHYYNAANVSATPFMRTPSLPIRTELTNTGTVSGSTTLDLVCYAYQKEAVDDLSPTYRFSASSVATKITVGNTILPILSIRPKTTFNSITNRIPIIPASVQVAANQNLIYVVVYLNATLTGASYTSAGTNSAVEFDVTATAVSGGTKLKEFYVPASTASTAAISEAVNGSIDLASLGLDIAGSVQDVLTVAARTTGGGTDTWTAVEWDEYQ